MLIYVRSGHPYKPPTNRIEKMLYPEHGDKAHWKDYPPRHKAVFTIKSHGVGYMAFVEVYERDSEKVIITGNSLWKNLPHPLEELESKINNYMNIPEVEKDFCI